MRRIVSFTLPILLLTIAALTIWRFGFTAPSVAEAQTAQNTKLVRTSGASVTPAAKPAAEISTAAMAAPPGTSLYVARRGDSVISIARHYISQTSYLTSTELSDAIRSANGNLQGTYLKNGQTLIVPGMLDAPIVEKSVPVARDFEVRAVYLTGIMAGSDRGIKIIRRWRELGGNAVVFDIKDSDGSVNIPFEDPLLGAHHTPIRDLPKFTRFLHS
ncbi:MAG TPA: LysM peptidoglycan-binding domain-containing protein, partial [Terriglobales bacterium]